MEISRNWFCNPYPISNLEGIKGLKLKKQAEREFLCRELLDCSGMLCHISTVPQLGWGNGYLSHTLCQMRGT